MCIEAYRGIALSINMEMSVNGVPQMIRFRVKVKAVSKVHFWIFLVWLLGPHSWIYSAANAERQRIAVPSLRRRCFEQLEEWEDEASR